MQESTLSSVFAVVSEQNVTAGCVTFRGERAAALAGLGEKRRINFGYIASHSTAIQAECKCKWVWVCTTSSSAQPCSRLAVVPWSSVEIQRRMGAGPMKQKMVLMVPRGSGPAAYYDDDVELSPPLYLLTWLALALCLCASPASLVL